MDTPEVIASPGRIRPPRPPSRWAAARREATVTAGLVLPNDVHPTGEGQRLLADTVESVAD